VNYSSVTAAQLNRLLNMQIGVNIMKKLIMTISSFLFLSACASIVEGTDQTVNFEISPESATCNIIQKGNTIATLKDGGGQVIIPKSRTDLSIRCQANGYKKQSLSIESSASGWGVVGCIFIDLCITDYSTGALNKYPKSIRINLQKN